MMNSSTLFIDESGKSSLAQAGSKPFLLTGVILSDQEIQTVEGFFNYIKLKYKISTENPFHSYDLYENPSTRINESEAESLSKTLADFLSLIPVEIHVAFTYKPEFWEALGINSERDFKGSTERNEMKDFPYRVMGSYLFGKFGKFLERADETGQVIADSRRGADHQLLKTLTLCKENHVPFKDGYSEQIQKRVTAICFAEKGYLSGGLEITDLVSYVAFCAASRQLSRLKNLGLSYIWNQIRHIAKIQKIDSKTIRNFFKLKKGEAHKYLKT